MVHMPDELPQDVNSGFATPEEMQAAIEASGYLLKGRIARLMGERGSSCNQTTSVNGSVIPVQIDVLTEAAFPKLIEKILEELKTFRNRMNIIYDRLLNSARDQKRVALNNAIGTTFKDYLDRDGALYP